MLILRSAPIALALVLLTAAATQMQSQHYPRHAVSADYAGLVLYGSASLSYEFLASDQMSFRAGYGASYATIIVTGVEARGWTFMMQFMTRGRHKIEGGIGLSVLRSNVTLLFDDTNDALGYAVFPALSLTYRSLPARSGLFWRVGLAWIFGYGLPLTLGVGYVF